LDWPSIEFVAVIRRSITAFGRVPWPLWLLASTAALLLALDLRRAQHQPPSRTVRWALAGALAALFAAWAWPLRVLPVTLPKTLVRPLDGGLWLSGLQVLLPPFDGAHSAAIGLALGVVALGACLCVAELTRRLSVAGRDSGSIAGAVPLGALLVLASLVARPMLASNVEALLGLTLVMGGVYFAVHGQVALGGLLAGAAVWIDPLAWPAPLALALGLVHAGDPRGAARAAGTGLLLGLASWGVFAWLSPSNVGITSSELTHVGPLRFGPYSAHGFRTLVVSLIGTGLILWLPWVARGAQRLRGHLLGTAALLQLFGYTFATAWGGQDIEFGAAALRLLPWGALLAEAGILAFAERRPHAVWLAFALLPLCLVALPTPFVAKGKNAFGSVDSADERRASRVCGEQLDRTLALLDVPGTVVALGEASPLAYCFERARVVRLRAVSPQYPTPRKTLSLRIDVSDRPLFPGPYAALTRFDLDGRAWFLGNGSSPLRQRLSAAQLPIGDGSSLPDDTELARECGAAFETTFGGDTTIRDPWQREMGESIAAHFMRSPEAFSLASELDLRAGTRTGHAFNERTQDREAHLDSRGGPRRERELGQSQSTEFPLTGELMTLEVAGGQDPDRLRVALLVNGELVRSTSGCGADASRPVRWDVSAWRGQRARLLASDASDAGYLAVSSVRLWNRR
jgi:hypothetical protein